MVRPDELGEVMNLMMSVDGGVNVGDDIRDEKGTRDV